MTNANTHKSIDERIIDAQKAIAAVATDSRVEADRGPKYNYASTEDIVKECRKALHEAGLSVSRTGAVMGERLPDLPPTRQGNEPRAWCKVTTSFRVSAIGTTEYRDYTIDLPAIDGGGKGLDKAVLGCMTSALGYFIVGLLLVARLDENEISAMKEEERRERESKEPPIGDEEAEKIRVAVEAAGLKTDILIATAVSKNPSLPANIAQWPRSKAALAWTWIETMKKRASKQK